MTGQVSDDGVTVQVMGMKSETLLSITGTGYRRPPPSHRRGTLCQQGPFQGGGASGFGRGTRDRDGIHVSVVFCIILFTPYLCTGPLSGNRDDDLSVTKYNGFGWPPDE